MSKSPSIIQEIHREIQEITKKAQAKMWELEPRDPPTLLSRWLKDLENYSGRVPMHGPIIIREKESTGEDPLLGLDWWACITLMCGSDPDNAEGDINLARCMEQENTNESP